jgi:UDP-N-acetylmuramate--alanine ligase
MAGLHNVLDALATVAVADVFEVGFDTTREALEGFGGVDRRFTVRGRAGGVTVVDDYGHHPTEIEAVLNAARQVATGRIVVLFQPHRYSRTQALFNEFLTAFFLADVLYVMDVYPAGEKPIPGVTGEALCDGIRQRGHKRARCLPDRETVAREISEELEAGDLLITLGAGDVTRLGPELLSELERKEGHTA